jgi:hypothetical protein
LVKISKMATSCPLCSSHEIFHGSPVIQTQEQHAKIRQEYEKRLLIANKKIELRLKRGFTMEDPIVMEHVDSRDQIIVDFARYKYDIMQTENLKKLHQKWVKSVIPEFGIYRPLEEYKCTTFAV